MHELQRNNVRVLGNGPRTMILAHGFGCDQNMWRHFVPAFEKDFRLVLFDYVGHGRRMHSAFDRTAMPDLDGYADDVLEICEALGHPRCGVRRPLRERHDRHPRRARRIRALQRAGAHRAFAPLRERRGLRRRLHARGHRGLLDFLDSNFLGWSSTMAPVIMGNAGSSGLERGAGEQLLPHRSRRSPSISRASRSCRTTARIWRASRSRL